MQDIFDLIAAVKAGNWWTAIKLVFTIGYKYKDVLPNDGDPKPVMGQSFSGDTIDGLVAELEFQSAQPVAAGVQAQAIPWKSILDILMRLLPLLFQKT